MLFFKFLALVGALLGIYVAAALQSSPEVADANLCKLLRRISSEVPDRCTQSIDNYATVIAILFVLLCVLILLWDFRKHPFWHTVKIGLAKVVPHLIPIGLIVIVIGAVIVGIGAWQKPNIVEVRSFGFAPSPSPPPLPPEPPPRRYTAYEKEQRLRAVDEIYSVLTTEIAPAYTQVRDVINNIYTTVGDGTAVPKLQDYSVKAHAAFNDLNTLLEKYEYFPDIVQSVKKNPYNVVAATNAAQNLTEEIQQLRNKVPNDMRWFLDRDVVLMEARNSMRDFDTYLKETMPRLQEKRAEIEKADVYSDK
jgi:NADH:ubiquinone oxidoreductase subunit 5 (subunit L)/multisubunit Na+/H+ antiporter MnhA subunit